MAKTELDVARGAALLAGKFIKAHLGKIKHLRYKADINIVTDVDKKAEEIIIRKLSKSFPDYGIISEERPAEERGKNKWIIDPLDGTTNFVHQFPFFAVSIGLEKKGEIVLGVVYDPVREELFTGEKNKDAFLNKKRISVSKTKNLGKAFLATGFSYRFKEKIDNNIDNFIKFMMASLAVRRAGSASLDMCYVACGRFDGFWEQGLYPWDTAAASLIVSESGGKVTHYDGSRFNHYQDTILATNGFLHAKMINILKTKK